MKHNADENEQAAAILIEAIKLLADSPEALENLQSYLEQHFNTIAISEYLNIRQFREAPRSTDFHTKQGIEVESVTFEILVLVSAYLSCYPARDFNILRLSVMLYSEYRLLLTDDF